MEALFSAALRSSLDLSFAISFDAEIRQKES
jgi:hypothetical protein